MDAFAEKLQKLMSEYRSLKVRNSQLQAEIEKKNSELSQAADQNFELRKKYEQVLFVSQYGGGAEERAAAKKQIDKLVGEVDKCLALLDE